MTSEDYKSVDTVKGALGSIARLGRAAAVHLALACQRASGSTISTDLKNNIQILNMRSACRAICMRNYPLNCWNSILIMNTIVKTI